MRAASADPPPLFSSYTSEGDWIGMTHPISAGDVFGPAFKTTKKTISGATSTMPKKRRKALERKALERFSLRVY